MRKKFKKSIILLIGLSIGIIVIYSFAKLMKDDVFLSRWHTGNTPLKRIFQFEDEPISSRWAVKRIEYGGMIPGPPTIQIWGITTISKRSADQLKEKYIWIPYKKNDLLFEVPGFDINRDWLVSDDIRNEIIQKTSYNTGIILLHGNMIYFFLQVN